MTDVCHAPNSFSFGHVGSVSTRAGALTAGVRSGTTKELENTTDLS